MGTLRIVRDFGDVSAVLPEGIDSVAELPHTIFTAMTLGLMYLGWEELPRDERPPRLIWTDMDKLKIHFDAVDKRRKADTDPRADLSDRAIEDPRSNEVALIAE